MKKLVLSHLSPIADDPALPDVLLAAARKDYSGEIIVAKDLMEI